MFVGLGRHGVVLQTYPMVMVGFGSSLFVCDLIVVWVWLYWVAALFERPKGCFATTDAKTKPVHGIMGGWEPSQRRYARISLAMLACAVKASRCGA